MILAWVDSSCQVFIGWGGGGGGGGGGKSLCHEKKYIDVSMFTYIGMINLTMVVNSTKSDRDFKIMIL